MPPEPGVTGAGSDPHGDDYSYSESNPTYYEQVNGTELNQRWGTEDLNRNSQLDMQEDVYRITIDTDSGEYVAQTYLDGWKLYRISLNDLTVSAYGLPDWSFVEYARVWVRGRETETNIPMSRERPYLQERDYFYPAKRYQTFSSTNSKACRPHNEGSLRVFHVRVFS